MTTQPMNLKISNLSKTYPNGVKALQDINLEINAGMFGLLGPNGAGKSSLMRTLATLQDADSGEIQLGKLDVLRQKNEVRKVLGYLPQEFGFYPNSPAIDMLDSFAKLKGILDGAERKTVVDNLLVQTNLWDHRKKRLGTFSGGMRQRFGIAIALLGSPQLIIVDEPTAGLDPVERNRFLDLLSEIGENIIVILSTHIVEDVAELCSQMAILAKGRIILQGKPAELLQTMQGKIFKLSSIKENLAEIKASSHVISSKLVSGKPLVRIYAGDGHCDFRDAVLAEPGLEDIYFYHIGSQDVLAGEEAARV